MSICADYGIKSNVASIEQAEVIFLGEYHYTEDHQRFHAKIIDALFNPGDIVFIEDNGDVPKETLKQRFQIKFVQSPITIKGWDCYSLVNDFFIPAVKNWIKPAVISSTITIFLGRMAGNSYHLDKLVYGVCALFNITSLLYFITFKIKTSIPQRNRHLYKILDNNPVPQGNRQYVIGGYLHFAVDRLYKEDFGIDISIDLDTFLKGKKYAILIPKDLEPCLVNFP